MNRKEFLRLATTATVGTPFLLNGMTAQVMNNFQDMPMVANNINDRVLVIVRLAGANDGLNTVIPISQYSDYVALRPNIHIKNTGSNKYIDLDTTLQDNQLSGLHPTLTGFKDLYDSGKMAVVNGVGYPSPNFSHFRSQNTMFAGRDGTNNSLLFSGMFGRYLAALYPGLANNPTSSNSDPLALQFGTTNPCLFYGHDHESGIEYNGTSLQDDFFTQLSSFNMTSPTSEYQELLDFILATEDAMDLYYNRVQQVFNSGVNSSVTYPNTSLAKQLKTVARMIQGGSKTKIFQVTLSGFDTHANQTQSGSSHTGGHANLNATMSDAIKSFQEDIEALGINDKVLGVTFSEFGRRVRENGNLGTDHGTLSPFFVFGTSVEAGVYGTHPVFTNTTDYLYSESERKYDYRQLFATLMQDWLGANDTLMQEAELDNFSTQANKIPLIKTEDNAYPDNLMGAICSNINISAVALTTDNGWTYYGEAGSTDYLFAIEHTPTGNGANTDSFTATVTTEKLCDEAPNNVHKIEDPTTGEGVFALGMYWNITLDTGTTNGWVNLRWFTDTELEASLTTVATDFYTNAGSTSISPILDLQTNSTINLPSQLDNDGLGISNPYTPLLNTNTGTYLSKEYIQYNQVITIANTGGGRFIKVTNINQNTPFVDDSNTVKGSIRYNTVTNKIEGFDGTAWRAFH